MSAGPVLRSRAMPLLVLTALGAAAGCGGGDGTGPPDPSGEVAAVEVTPRPAAVAVGQTLPLVAVTKDADGARLSGRRVTWTTSASDVATVSASGAVTGVAPGAATITATSEGIDGITELTVVATSGIVRSWQGGASGRASDWSVAANWAPVGIPDALDVVRIPKTASAVALSEDVVVARLIVAGGVLRTGGHRLVVRPPER